MTCLQLASQPPFSRYLIRDPNEEGAPWKPIREAVSAWRPEDLDGEKRWLSSCTVEFRDGTQLFRNNDDILEVGIIRA